jgi:hypothetical protein
MTELPRKPGDWVTPEILRALLKQNLGLNTRKVSVKKRSSNTFLAITILDPSVDFAAVKRFAKQFDTFSMDNTDLATGQSVDVELSDKVRTALAVCYRFQIENCPIPERNQGHEIAPGITMWNIDNEVWLERRSDRKRSGRVLTSELKIKARSSVDHLAVQLALFLQEDTSHE